MPRSPSTTNDMPPVLVWFRQDLRLNDNPALAAAAASGAPLAFLYILDDETPGAWRMGGASRWWLHQSLQALESSLKALGARLILRRGRGVDVLPAVAAEIAARAVYWNRQYEPYAVARDAAIKAALAAQGVKAESANGALLFEPWTIRTKDGGPFKVFTPFWRACLSAPGPAAPVGRVRFKPWTAAATSDTLAAWTLKPTRPDWAGGLRDAWRPGEAAALARLDTFLEDAIARYAADRDTPASEATTRLSPHLHWGEIAPSRIWRAVQDRLASSPRAVAPAEKLLAELGWREFSHHLLFHWPTIPETPWREAFDAIAWRDDLAAFRAWSRGLTGYPIVDAGMRQLWATGWMHNRVRMIAASFLIKDLLIDWRQGQNWFWDTLVDADLAANAASWQWVAGSGADAAPYFRIFNPSAQGQKHDSSGAYVRRWIPELSKLPDAHIHAPWTAPPLVLREAGIRLGETYPEPIIDHAFARKRALDAFAALKGAATSAPKSQET